MRPTSSSLLIVLFAVVLLLGCEQGNPGPRLTPLNYDRVGVGTTKAQVESILGPPTKVEERQALVFGDGATRWDPITTFRYEEGPVVITITFRGDQVEKKESNLWSTATKGQ